MEQNQADGQRFEFGDFVLDIERAALLRNAEIIALSPKEFEVLSQLVEHSGCLVTKEELFSRVWPDVFVSDSSLLRTVSVLRKHLGHDAIRTIPKRGYAFALAVKGAAIGPGFPSPDCQAGSDVGGAPGFVKRNRTAIGVGLALTCTVFGLVGGLAAGRSSLLGHHAAAVTKVESAGTSNSPATASRVFVLNQHARSISMLNSSTHTVSMTVSLPGDPRGIAILPDTTDVYVSLNAANSVAVFDTKRSRVRRIIPVGKNPVGVLANPRPPYVYVANNYSNTVSVIDSGTQSVVKTLAVGRTPTEMAISGDGTTVVVSNQSSGSLTLIDAVKNEVLATVLVGSTPVGVAFTRDSKSAWVTLAGENAIAVVDIADPRVTKRIPVGLAPVRVAFTRDGRQAVVSDFYSDALTLVDVRSMTPTRTIPVGLNPVGINFDDAGLYLFAANYGSDTVSVIDARTMKLLTTTPVGKAPVDMAVLPCFVSPCDEETSMFAPAKEEAEALGRR